MIQTACPCCSAIILSPRMAPDLDRDALVAIAVTDAYGDQIDGLSADPERHLPALARHIGPHQHEQYRHAYATASEHAGRQRSLHEATWCATETLAELDVPAGLG